MAFELFQTESQGEHSQAVAELQILRTYRDKLAERLAAPGAETHSRQRA